MSYTTYKMLHLVALFMMFGALALSLLQDQQSKLSKIYLGVSSFIVLVGGMGLMARLGVSHGGAWPHWLKMKFIIWGIIAVGAPVTIKRLGFLKKPFYIF